MKQIKLGSFFGKNIYLETDESDTFDYSTKFENWIKGEKANAIQSYKEDLFMKELEKKIPKNPTFFTGVKEFLTFGYKL